MGRSGKTVECVIGYNGWWEKEFKGWFEFFPWVECSRFVMTGTLIEAGRVVHGG